jgi:hypothetical protein
MPWLNVGIALVVVPAVAMTGTVAFTRSRLPIELRRSCRGPSVTWLIAA